MKNLLEGILLIPPRVAATTMVSSSLASLPSGSDGIK